uniref:DB domain-containing protein n=1 Tax=Meloidogyne hapla TaxID=6305 RepID=A0A1I8BIK4_MELHA
MIITTNKNILFRILFLCQWIKTILSCISLGGCSFLSGYPGYQRCLTATGATYYRNCYGGICRHHRLKGSQILSLNESDSENNKTTGDENEEEEKDDFGAIQLRSMFLHSDDCPIESASIIHFCASQNQDHRECCLRSGIEQTRAGPKCLLFCDKMPENETLLDLSYLPCFERFSEMKRCFYENSLRTIDYLEAEMRELRRGNEHILPGNVEEREENTKIFQTSNPLIFINDVREKHPLINDAVTENIIIKEESQENN